VLWSRDRGNEVCPTGSFGDRIHCPDETPGKCGRWLWKGLPCPKTFFIDPAEEDTYMSNVGGKYGFVVCRS